MQVAARGQLPDCSVRRLKPDALITFTPCLWNSLLRNKASCKLISVHRLRKKRPTNNPPGISEGSEPGQLCEKEKVGLLLQRMRRKGPWPQPRSPAEQRTELALL